MRRSFWFMGLAETPAVCIFFFFMAPAFRTFTLRVSCVLLCILNAHIHDSVLAASPPGYQSIDCGGQYEGISTDSLGIDWVSDSSLINTGIVINESITPPSTNTDTQFKSVRYFPGNQTKYCYLLTVPEQSFYLVRASFWLGQQRIYDSQIKDKLDFELLIDADEWADISIGFPQAAPLVQEIYVRAQGTVISVCVARKGIGKDTPFISTIELRPLDSEMNAVSTMIYTRCALHKQYRLNLGDPSTIPVRYPDDSFDRIWDAQSSEQSTNTTTSWSVGIPDSPPVIVLQTAQGGDGLRNFKIPLAVDGGSEHEYYYALYFAEIDPKVNGSGLRIFNVSVNDEIVWDNLDIYDDVEANSIDEIYTSNDTLLRASGYVNFTFRENSSSTYGPLISALELLQLSDNPQSSGTAPADATAVQNIAKTLRLNNWTGDPCLPASYTYNWLTCSYLAAPPRITDLSLSNQNLFAQIPSSINTLTELVRISLNGNGLYGQIPDLSALESLQILDLSNNNLSGHIPNYLSRLPSLQTLLLQNNNLSGEISNELLELMSKGFLQFNFSGNPFLCKMENSTCTKAPSGTSFGAQKHKNIGLIIGLVLIGLFVVGMGAICLVLFNKRNAKKKAFNNLPHENVIQHTEVVERSNVARVFSYQEIVAATCNFSTKLNEGGFGPVYQGTIGNGVSVAMKVLSSTSHQGVKEFLNEVSLLTRIHHKSLVQLIGYCIEEHVILVYEYMSNGSLCDFLYGPKVHKLDWRTRLSIALDAAEGLQYLHQGCSPYIIHRDVKSSNILLNDNMEAKISDLGISKLRTNDNTITTGISTNVMGSHGYIDPQYALTSTILKESDVFSFGVVLLEIICGRPPLYKNLESVQHHITEWVKPMIQDGNIENIVDASIGNNYNVSSMWTVLEVAMICTQFSRELRPTMSEVCTEIKEAIKMEFENGKINTDIHDSTMIYEGTTSRLSLTHVEAR